MNPLDDSPTWQSTDSLPNGPQTMSDGILLPDGTVLIINGARIGSGGGFMVLEILMRAFRVKVDFFQADNPLFQPVIYNPAATAGSRLTTMPGSSIPRLSFDSHFASFWGGVSCRIQSCRWVQRKWQGWWKLRIPEVSNMI